jgi:hypothetical protein
MKPEAASFVASGFFLAEKQGSSTESLGRHTA